MATAKVIVEDRFRPYGVQVRRASERALGRAAGVGVAAGRQAASKYRIQGIQATVRASTTIESSRGGIRVPIIVTDYRGVFFALGTLARRRRRLKRPGARKRAAPPGSGITPQPFMRAALKAGREVLPAFLANEIGRIK